jgi:hypothetical protein
LQKPRLILNVVMSGGEIYRRRIPPPTFDGCDICRL